ncbi:hypothetical protein MPSEU_000232900 [Mayamaea pseudoterrestris]|nr:hypothetical protein MPSEU_000232900 [Mayamaea pseudoterrestris]
MVRFKSRFILITIDFPTASKNGKQVEFPSKQELSRALRDHFIETNGISVSGVALDIQVRFYNPETRLCLVRVPRSDAARIRASFCFLSSLASRRAMLSTISVHGSARTAKRAVIKEIARIYKAKILETNGVMDSVLDNRLKSQLHGLSQSVQEVIATVQAIDY